MAPFAIVGEPEATRGAGCCSWTLKCGSACSEPTGLRQISSMALFATQLGWHMTQTLNQLHQINA
ncbi:hypothetical protein [Planococcus donghaensis]|uniref:hypothetical protein n=1 Tax=Planococcus donghaensis TaxID=414778 RepID=UPI003734DFAA